MVLLMVAFLSNAITWHTPTNKTKEEKRSPPSCRRFRLLKFINSINKKYSQRASLRAFMVCSVLLVRNYSLITQRPSRETSVNGIRRGNRREPE
jgi:hypothetical protein